MHKIIAIMEWIYELHQIDEIAAEILPHLSSPVVVLKGSMGSGKTTLTKALVKAMNIKDEVSSPTFGLVNVYENLSKKVYHFDLYRIENEDEAFDIGIEEYFYSGHLCLVEWAERIPSFLPEKVQTLQLEIQNSSTRKIQLF